MLTDKIRLSGPPATSPEDILSSALAVIFPDDIINQHGDDDNSVIYLSPTYGPISLSLCAPTNGETRVLFSHFLWNASLQLAEFVEDGDGNGSHSGLDGLHVRNEEAGEGGKGKFGRSWHVEGRKVLELGAGTGLAGMIAALKGAQEVIISDYPAPEVLENLRVNVAANIEPRRKKKALEEEEAEKSISTISQRQNIGRVSVEGHSWGVLTDPFSVQNEEAFGRILVADCLWMPWQHENLLRSIRWFLAEDGEAWVIAGFHTGREKMAGFYEEKRMRECGLEVEAIWERDAEGATREWMVDRGREDITGRKRWLVIAILRRVKG